MSVLVPCPSCARHVRSSEPSCPFCTSALAEDLASRAVPAAGRRLDRLAAFTFAASLAVTGCSTTVGNNIDEQQSELGGIQPMYGMPGPEPVEDGGAADGGSDGGVEDGGPAPDGGSDGGSTDAGPAPDAGDAGADASPCGDLGGIQPMYGAPPFPVWDPCPVEEDGGAIQPMYGMPAALPK